MTDIVNERNFDDLFPPSARQRYWRRVGRALTDIFNVPQEVADRYRASVNEAPVGEQMLVYHDDPINVAADLAGESTITEGQMEQYRKLVDSEKSAP